MQNHVLVHNIDEYDFYLLLQPKNIATQDAGQQIQKTDIHDIISIPNNSNLLSISSYIFDQMEEGIHYTIDTTRSDVIYFPTHIDTYQIRNTEVFVQKEKKILGDYHIVGLMFPILLPVIQKLIETFSSNPNKTVHYFIQLLTKGTKHSEHSTYVIGHIVRKLALSLFPTIQFELCHNNHDDVSFHEQFQFFREIVIPYIQQTRQKVVDYYSKIDKKEWNDNFFVHLSINTGTTNFLVGTLQALHIFQPDFFFAHHATFWPTTLFEIEYIDYRSYQQASGVYYHALQDVQQFACREMKEWKTFYIQKKPKREYEYDMTRGEKPTFFFRKGQQEVLSIVVVENTKPDRDQKPWIAYRGVNLEVSLPTGSLCAERNAIGSALVDNPLLQREKILCVAVLSLTAKGPTLGPCGACQEWLTKVAEVNPNFTILTFADIDCNFVYTDAISLI